MGKLNFEAFEDEVDMAGVHNHDRLIDAVADADLCNFNTEQLKLVAEVLTHVSAQ